MADPVDNVSKRQEQAGASLGVEIVQRSDQWRAAGLDERLVERAAQCAFLAAQRGGGDAEVAIVLSADEEVRALNATWRRSDKPTNVLSFPAADHGTPHDEPRMLGDVVLAFETVSAEAQASAIDFADHTAHLVVHGVLHLLGHDHENDDEARAMEALERHVLAGLGIADPYEFDAVAELA